MESCRIFDFRPFCFFFAMFCVDLLKIERCMRLRAAHSLREA